jgi:UDP-N-acetylmuramyl pentapeptide phosphotransferase/UDP-N-acetylglucosamine-1-phosphate transferase
MTDRKMVFCIITAMLIVAQRTGGKHSAVRSKIPAVSENHDKFDPRFAGVIFLSAIFLSSECFCGIDSALSIEIPTSLIILTLMILLLFLCEKCLA